MRDGRLQELPLSSPKIRTQSTVPFVRDLAENGDAEMKKALAAIVHLNEAREKTAIQLREVDAKSAPTDDDVQKAAAIRRKLEMHDRNLERYLDDMIRKPTASQQQGLK